MVKVTLDDLIILKVLSQVPPPATKKKVYSWIYHQSPWFFSKRGKRFFYQALDRLKSRELISTERKTGLPTTLEISVTEKGRMELEKILKLLIPPLPPTNTPTALLDLESELDEDSLGELVESVSYTLMDGLKMEYDQVEAKKAAEIRALALTLIHKYHIH